jgi:23S rRNA (adenine2503-C2)-methyltransferase
MLAGVNDSLADAEELARLVKDLPSVVNLIPFNPWPGSIYTTSTDTAIKAFADRLSIRDVCCTGTINPVLVVLFVLSH